MGVRDELGGVWTVATADVGPFVIQEILGVCRFIVVWGGDWIREG